MILVTNRQLVNTNYAVECEYETRNQNSQLRRGRILNVTKTVNSDEVEYETRNQNSQLRRGRIRNVTKTVNSDEVEYQT